MYHTLAYILWLCKACFVNLNITDSLLGRSGFDSLKEDSDNVIVIPPRSPPASPVEQHHPVVASNMLRASQDADFKGRIRIVRIRTKLFLMLFF